MCVVCIINYHDTWSWWHLRQCMGTDFISLQVAVRRGKSSWNSWLIAGFSKHSTWAEAAAKHRTLYWRKAAWPLERPQHASRASCKVEDEEDIEYETVDSPRSTTRVVFTMMWQCGWRPQCFLFFFFSYANTSKETVHHLAWEILLHWAESLLLIMR